MRRGVVGSNTVLITVILGSVVILVLGIFAKMYFGAAENEFTERQCQASLMMDAFGDFVKLVCMQPVKKLAIKCERKFISMENEEIYLDGEEVTHRYDSSCPEGFSQDDCLQHNVLAQEMAECWRLMFKGEQRILGAAEENSIKLLKSKDALRACFVCAEMTLDQDAKDFKRYLQMKSFNDETYFTYIAKNPDAICDPDLEDLKPSDLDGFSDTLHQNTCWEGMAMGLEEGWFDFSWPRIDYSDIRGNTKYAVTFVRRGLGSCDVATDGGEEAVRDAYLTYTVQLVPASRMNEYCTMVMV